MAVAKRVSEWSTQDSKVEAAPAVVRPQYAAPELFEKHRVTQTRAIFATDVYSLAMVMYELVTLHRPWLGLDALDAWEALTPLGNHLASLPVEPRVGLMLLWSRFLGLGDSVLSLAGAMVSKDVSSV